MISSVNCNGDNADFLGSDSKNAYNTDSFNITQQEIERKFVNFTKDQQIFLVQGLLKHMSHYQHGQIDSYLKPMLQRDFITDLPAKGLFHVSEQILSYLDAKSLCAASQVSHSWHQVIKDGYLWKKLIERKVMTNSLWRGLGERRGWIKTLRIPGQHIHPRTASGSSTTLGSGNNNSRLHLKSGCSSHLEGVCLPGSTSINGSVTGAANCNVSVTGASGTAMPSSVNAASASSGTSFNNMMMSPGSPSSTTDYCGLTDFMNENSVITGYELMDPDYYRRLFPDILSYIRRIKQNWATGKCKVKKIECHSESSKGVYCLQYDDKKIVSGLRDNTIKVWDARTLECIRVLTGHVGSVLCLQYDDNVIISGSSDSTVRVWSLQNWTCVNTIYHHCEAVLHLRFAHSILVTCSKDRSIAVWDMVAPNDIRIRRVLVGHRAAVNVVDFDQKNIVSASGDRTIKVWNTQTCEFVHTMTGHKRGIACLQYRDNLVVSGSSDNSIRLWQIENGNCLRVLEGHEELVRCIRFDSKYIVSGAYDGKIKVWDLDAALNPQASTHSLCLQTLNEHTGRVFRLQFDEFQIVSSSHDDTILIWDFLDANSQENEMSSITLRSPVVSLLDQDDGSVTSTTTVAMATSNTMTNSSVSGSNTTLAATSTGLSNNGSSNNLKHHHQSSQMMMSSNNNTSNSNLSTAAGGSCMPFDYELMSSTNSNSTITGVTNITPVTTSNADPSLSSSVANTNNNNISDNNNYSSVVYLNQAENSSNQLNNTIIGDGNNVDDFITSSDEMFCNSRSSSLTLNRMVLANTQCRHLSSLSRSGSGTGGGATSSNSPNTVDILNHPHHLYLHSQQQQHMGVGGSSGGIENNNSTSITTIDTDDLVDEAVIGLDSSYHHHHSHHGNHNYHNKLS